MSTDSERTGLGWPRCPGAMSIIGMIRIAITAAAYDAIVSTLPVDAPPWPVHRQDIHIERFLQTKSGGRWPPEAEP